MTHTEDNRTKTFSYLIGTILARKIKLGEEKQTNRNIQN